jgi:hypothetical protein
MFFSFLNKKNKPFFPLQGGKICDIIQLRETLFLLLKKKTSR